MEEVLVPAIQYSLDNRLRDNAVFLAERLHAVQYSATSVHYLAKVHLALNKPQYAHAILLAADPSSLLYSAPHNRYLFAQSCFEIGQLQQAEAALLYASKTAALSIYGLSDPVLDNDMIARLRAVPCSAEVDGLEVDAVLNVPNGAAGWFLLGLICKYVPIDQCCLSIYLS